MLRRIDHAMARTYSFTRAKSIQTTQRIHLQCLLLRCLNAALALAAVTQLGAVLAQPCAIALGLACVCVLPCVRRAAVIVVVLRGHHALLSVSCRCYLRAAVIRGSVCGVVIGLLRIRIPSP